METLNVYQENGFNSRRDYLVSLAEDFGVAQDFVFTLASLLGKNEDFDGLITAIEDYDEYE
jgi:hypothetical protein